MLSLSKKLNFIFGLFLLSGFVFGQTNPNTTTRTDTRGMSPEQIEFIRGQERIQRENQQHADMLQLERDKTASTLPPRTKADGKPYSKEELKVIKALLEPSPEDLIKYRDFLQQPKTGLFRLFPDFDCETKHIIRSDGDCENFIPGSWSYSFRLKNHIGPDFSDIRFSDKYLISDSFLSQGIMVPLGDIPLENILLTSDGMKFLNDFKPATDKVEARKQFAQIAKVFASDGYIYSKKVKVVENVTYGMRMIAYRSKVNDSSQYRYGENNKIDKFLGVNNFDKRIDLTLAFRVVRKTQDGGITIIWKELERRDAPQLVFKKDEKISDIK